MNYSRLVKIIPMLDSANDAEALAALRAVARALAPETFGDVARLIESSLEVEPLPEPEAKPFTGFKPTAKGPKPEKPLGDGWIWSEPKWNWVQVPKPAVSRFQTFSWNDPNWNISTNFPEVLTAAMQVMALKLSRSEKTRANAIALAAMEDKPIQTYELIWLQEKERTMVNV